MVSLLPEVHALRQDISAYDAMYVVLARAARCSMLTLDARLAACASDCAVLPQSRCLPDCSGTGVDGRMEGCPTSPIL
ncbi:type II toxin-antitoxin system VapC family toxin [Microbacterium gorillae]|uniref:type II toxin-antitoxin system VapC family toxin n=1 Tax=Microbacterium gorillae TaxID=1231063 RepID=UPI003D989ED2